jgi:TDG/mug DNA glycosylase family protein
MSDKARPSLRAAQGFPPIIDATSRVLILGTMPGEESLRRQEYYGHPRNQFWRILADLFYVPLAETYPERVALLRQRRLAVWDVLQYCERQGSLDQAICNAVPNDFRGMFKTHGNLRAIVFNGRKAQDLFEHTVIRQQGLEWIELPRLLMPSTSPAATLPLSAKIERWHRISAWIVEK